MDPPEHPTAETVICTYRVRADALGPFCELLRRHWPTLSRLGLVTDTPEQLYVGGEHRGGEPIVVSIFEWVGGEAAERAHDHPEVADIWEAMEPLCEPRGGMPSMDFPHFRPLVLP